MKKKQKKYIGVVTMVAVTNRILTEDEKMALFRDFQACKEFGKKTTLHRFAVFNGPLTKKELETLAK